MSLDDVVPGATMKDWAGHSYLVLDTRVTIYASHSQRQPAEVLVRRGDGTERWCQSTTIAAMLAEGRITITPPAQGAAA
ncbi:hypothetical protein UFOVP233_43 [uncultured Caudovirales phage]|uniref:Uncharacterized protein n=1 Tax=uncultured Caudovirales phage TaxID=2100421 RepID=A0A6J7WQW8_9CAUD|nr:hypothetical protein UFOVP233_43 [uncultured Caudovirales phage]